MRAKDQDGWSWTRIVQDDPRFQTAQKAELGLLVAEFIDRPGAALPWFVGGGRRTRFPGFAQIDRRKRPPWLSA